MEETESISKESVCSSESELLRKAKEELESDKEMIIDIVIEKLGEKRLSTHIPEHGNTIREVAWEMALKTVED